MKITRITYIDDDSSTSSSQTKITKTESSSQSVSSLEERPSSPTSSTGTQSISNLDLETSSLPLPSIDGDKRAKLKSILQRVKTLQAKLQTSFASTYKEQYSKE